MFFPIFFTCVRIHWISKATKIAANKYRIFVCSTSFGIVGWDGNSQAKKTWDLTLRNILLL